MYSPLLHSDGGRTVRDNVDALTLPLVKYEQGSCGSTASLCAEGAVERSHHRRRNYTHPHTHTFILSRRRLKARDDQNRPTRANTTGHTLIRAFALQAGGAAKVRS